MTVLQVVSASYKQELNGVGRFDVNIDGAGSALRSAAVVGAEVSIYYDGSLDFKGVIIERNQLSGGGLAISGLSILNDFVEEECPVDSGKRIKTYTSTDDDTVFADLVSNVSGWSSDVSGSTASGIDAFRVSESMSVWEGVISLIRQTGKDIYADYSTKTLYLTDSKGSSGAFYLLEGREVANISERQRKAKASKVLVYGKGDGENQIVGSAGSGTPVQRIYDRNIISTTAANQRATSELALVSSAVKNYTFDVIKTNLSVVTGDQGTLTAFSYGLNDEDVDVVSVVRSINSSGSERLSLEVTNPDYRQASRSLQMINAEANQNSLIANSSMLGTSNVLTFSGAMNAKNGSPLRRIFYLASEDITDEAGNIRVDRMTLDWDIDPFRRDFGTASESNIAPSLSAGNADTHKHDPSDDGHLHSIVSTTSDNTAVWEDEGGDNDSSYSLSSGRNANVLSTFVSGTFEYLAISYTISPLASYTGQVELGIYIDNLGAPGDQLRVYSFDGNAGAVFSNLWIRDTMLVPIHGSISGTIDMDILSNGSYSISASMGVYGYNLNHSHDISALTSTQTGIADVDDANRNPGLNGNAASHNHGVSIGDDVDDSGSVNSSDVDIYLDFWNGSSWVNKRTWSGQVLLQENFDLTDSGSYPDAAGYWRVRVEPNSSSPDFAQCVVRVKHALDN